VTLALARIDARDLQSEGPARAAAEAAAARALEEVGFFALVGHDVTPAVVDAAYDRARAFFALPEAEKLRFERADGGGQRGYVRFGREHAKDHATPDLKEFWQVGRVDVADDHPVHARWGPNLWPDEVVPGFRGAATELYTRLERLGSLVLRAIARAIGEPDDRFAAPVADGDTILRIIHYPALHEAPPPGAVRAAAHEDINFITLLLGATAEGLELLDREGRWRPVRARHDELVVDAGDMLQNLTNGLFRATTHRVVVPEGAAAREARYSMPLFVHPRADTPLGPLPACIARTGGAPRYPRQTAGEFLARRLAEIGLA
jgi:isopenicillin N synthase-like dioxygenase